MKYIDETRNYFIEEHLLILTSAVTGCVSISAFSSLVGLPIGTASSAVALKICAITAGIKKYKSIIKKKRKKHDKIVLLVKTKLKTIQVLISRALIDSYIRYDEFVSENNILKEYDYMKKAMKILKTSTDHQRF